MFRTYTFLALTVLFFRPVDCLATELPRDLPSPARRLGDWREARRLIENVVPQLAIARSDQQLSEADRTTQRSYFLPSAQMSADLSRWHPSSVGGSPSDSNERVEFSISVPLINISAWRKTRTAQLNVDAASEDVRETRRVLYENLLRTVIVVDAYQKLYQVALSNLDNTLRILGLYRGATRAGLAAEIDVLRAQQQVFDAQDEVIRAFDAAMRARQQLGLALGSDEPWGVSSDMAADFAPLFGSCMRLDASAQRSDVLASSLRAESRKRGPEDSWTELLPTVHLQASQSYSRLPEEHISNNSVELSGKLALRWNLFDGGRTLASMERARAQSTASYATMRLTQLEAEQTVAKLKREKAIAEQRLQVGLDRRATGRRLLKLVENGVQEGLLSSLDQSASQAIAREAELNVVLLEMELRLAEARLELSLMRC